MKNRFTKMTMWIKHLASMLIHAEHVKRAFWQLISSNDISMTLTMSSLSFTLMLLSCRNKLNTESQAVCLDFSIIYILINSNFIVDHSHLFSKTLCIHNITSDSNHSNELILLKHVNLQLYIYSNNEKSKVFVTCKIYVMNDFDTDLLINMNIIQLKDIMLNCSKSKLTMSSHYSFTTFFFRMNNMKKTVTYHYEMK